MTWDGQASAEAQPDQCHEHERTAPQGLTDLCWFSARGVAQDSRWRAGVEGEGAAVNLWGHEARQSSRMDCFVASQIAMTGERIDGVGVSH